MTESTNIKFYGMLFRVTVKIDPASNAFTVTAVGADKVLGAALIPEKSGFKSDATRGIAYLKNDDTLGLVEVF